MDTLWTVGARVLVTDDRSGRAQETTVAKVHKNGNVVLASDPGIQWGPSGDYASPRGTAYRWSTMGARVFTPDNSAGLTSLLDDARRASRWLGAMKKLERVKPGWVQEALVAAVEAAIKEHLP